MQDKVSSKEEKKMEKVECLKLFESCCIDFWGEKKTPKKIREAWEDWLASLREDGEKVPEYKLTRAEVDNLMKA